MHAQSRRGGGARLVRSKLRPPALPDGAVLRPHLLDRLRSGQGQVLTLVCAPAGYGKTTLLTQWLEAGADASDFAWVTLDSGDADPARFWRFLISALSQVAPRAGRGSLRALRRRPGQLTAGALPLLMEELDAGGQSLVLVLEDYHLAQGPGLDESMAFFIERRPACVQVVLADCRRAAGDAARARDGLDLATGTLDRIPDPGILAALAASLRRKLEAPARRPALFGQELSGREVAVLRLLSAGLAQREIAAQLHVSRNTVKTHVQAIYRKLGAGTRAQAVHQAKELGVL